jgi:hypothetical protein
MLTQNPTGRAVYVSKTCHFQFKEVSGWPSVVGLAGKFGKCCKSHGLAAVLTLHGAQRQELAHVVPAAIDGARLWLDFNRWH